MIPGLAFLYGGLARRKNSLQLLGAVVFSNAVVVFQWYLWGYSLAFSRTATNGFIGVSVASPNSSILNSVYQEI
jgi:ammonium transporter, Amt family